MATIQGLELPTLQSATQREGFSRLQTVRDFLWRKRTTLAGLLMMSIFGIVVLRCAWITEDAYIMFRTIEQQDLT